MYVTLALDSTTRPPQAGDTPVVDGATIRVARDAATGVYHHVWDVKIEDEAALRRLLSGYRLTVSPPAFVGTDAHAVVHDRKRPLSGATPATA